MSEGSELADDIAGQVKHLRPLRVVHYPGDPDDIGVVCEDGDGLVVLWHDGANDVLSECNRLTDLDGVQPVTVSRSPRRCRKVKAWHVEAVRREDALWESEVALMASALDAEPGWPPQAPRPHLLAAYAPEEAGRPTGGNAGQDGPVEWTTVCAWCDVVIHEGTPGAPTSHGVCASCAGGPL